ncbi:MAG TPA: sulfurtransferase [Rhodocyclaceae bacterium]|nr:sulfurtransferase [Rhodocyclaceae bacterium]
MWQSIQEWTVAQLQKALAEETETLRPEVIDVREAWEVAQMPFPGARHLPMHLIPLSLDTLPRDRPIVVVCHSGARSAQVVYFLQQNGFDAVYNLQGGMVAWVREAGAAQPEAQGESR